MEGLFKNVLGGVARKLGIELVPEWRIDNLMFARFLNRLFDVYAIDCVIDVGANRGQYRDFLRKHVGYQGQIVSFEPDLACIDLLRTRAERDERWHIEAVALGRESGEFVLNVMADSRFNSFLSPNGTVTPEFRDVNRVLRQDTVPVKALDDYSSMFSALGVSRFYLKMDTQGYDLEVLRGARDFLPTVSALQTEASVRPIYSDMPDFYTVIAFLEGAGFALSNGFPVSADPGLRLIEFDCIAVNAVLADDIAKRSRP